VLLSGAAGALPRPCRGAARPEPTVIWIIALAIVVLNLPFGFWRAGVRKFSWQWFVAVHAPVPLAIGLRLASGLGWHLATLPLFVAAFFGGQFLGGRLRGGWDLRRASLGREVGETPEA
jgi:hypothetical protein